MIPNLGLDRRDGPLGRNVGPTGLITLSHANPPFSTGDGISIIRYES